MATGDQSIRWDIRTRVEASVYILSGNVFFWLLTLNNTNNIFSIYANNPSQDRPVDSCDMFFTYFHIEHAVFTHETVY